MDIFGDTGTKFPHTRAQLGVIARLAVDDEQQDEGNTVPGSFVTKVVGLLVEEREEELRSLLVATYGLDRALIDQAILDLMHKHRDDVAGVPFLFLTPTKRPISRPSSRASNPSTRLHPPRPDTPNSAPSSPLAQIFKRPHTPAASPLASYTGSSNSYMTARPSSEYEPSPNVSPVLSHAIATQAHAQFASSLPASPLSSPRLLNAKASEFRPVIQRPLSAAGAIPGTILRSESPDLWTHNITNSPRPTSNLAIAAPLIPERSRSQSPSLHPHPTNTTTPALGRSASLNSGIARSEDGQDDPFDPFGPTAESYPFPNTYADQWDEPWLPPGPSNPYDFNGHPIYPSIDDMHHAHLVSQPLHEDEMSYGEPDTLQLTDGMTPFDVLSSVFGSTLPPSELEEALTVNNYDFEKAATWLVEKALPQPAPAHNGSAPPRQQQNVGGRVTVVSRDSLRGRGAVGLGLYTSDANGRTPPRYVNGRPVAGGGNRVCRYFVAGECLRADCRFSHDLERALCRFWLRGTCAKNDQCEFLHHLPKDVDIQGLRVAMSRAGVAPGTGPLGEYYPPPDPQQQHHSEDFPVLGQQRYDTNGQSNGSYDPGRTRFAAAVKKAPTSNPTYVSQDPMMVSSSSSASELANNSNAPSLAVIAPRPSPRLPLRLPTLIPSIPTGSAVNQLYMAYRQRALQLGQARNACLSRAADAWRRGDGAAAKRFSRDANGLNVKMRGEMRTAASGLVRERGRIVRDAVVANGGTGKECGSGLGVLLGSASLEATGGAGKTLTSDERMECIIDLHGLHSNEATEVLEEFLLALEQEHFYGLAYAIVGEEKHTGTQDPGRGASRARLAAGVKEWLHRWGYPWNERDGIVWIDPLTHADEAAE
ncbi:hypothetical protein DL96DRAFT_1458568 [Flagelloscypha sp. PMI_526]|nr:hypothetical protein DL96DRAFT_1458568 [Flagelloscypha sp. PMI_526]